MYNINKRYWQWKGFDKGVGRETQFLDLDWKFEKCFSDPGQGNLKLFTPKIMEMSFVTLWCVTQTWLEIILSGFESCRAIVFSIQINARASMEALSTIIIWFERIWCCIWSKLPPNIFDKKCLDCIVLRLYCLQNLNKSPCPLDNEIIVGRWRVVRGDYCPDLSDHLLHLHPWEL